MPDKIKLTLARVANATMFVAGAALVAYASVKLEQAAGRKWS